MNGIVTGAAIAMLAVAFSMVYVPTRIFHLTLGVVYTAAPYVALQCIGAGWPIAAAVAAGVLAGTVISLASEILNHWPLEQRGASSSVHMVSALAIYTVVVQVIVLCWGSETRVFRTGIDASWGGAGSTITKGQALVLSSSVLMLAASFSWLWFTGAGLRLRALASNSVEFALCGHNAQSSRAGAFIIAGLLASVTGLVTALDLGFGPYGGFPVLLLAIVAAIVGGRGSFAGPVVGALLLGALRSEVTWFLSTRWQDTVTFLLFIGFLVLRPGGMLGARRERLEAVP